MSSYTPGQIAKKVAKALEEERPDLRVTEAKGDRVGDIRLIRMTLADGRFAQFSCSALGTHYGRLVNRAVAEASRVFPPRAT